MRETKLKSSDYWKQLNQVLDDIFSEADNQKLNDSALAKLSGLCQVTVWRLNNRVTEYPYFATVMKLAQAVGLQILVTKLKISHKKAG